MPRVEISKTKTIPLIFNGSSANYTINDIPFDVDDIIVKIINFNDSGTSPSIFIIKSDLFPFNEGFPVISLTTENFYQHVEINYSVKKRVNGTYKFISVSPIGVDAVLDGSLILTLEFVKYK